MQPPLESALLECKLQEMFVLGNSTRASAASPSIWRRVVAHHRRPWERHAPLRQDQHAHARCVKARLPVLVVLGRKPRDGRAALPCGPFTTKCTYGAFEDLRTLSARWRTVCGVGSDGVDSSQTYIFPTPSPLDVASTLSCWGPGPLPNRGPFFACKPHGAVAPMRIARKSRNLALFSSITRTQVHTSATLRMLAMAASRVAPCSGKDRVRPMSIVLEVLGAYAALVTIVEFLVSEARRYKAKADKQREKEGASGN